MQVHIGIMKIHYGYTSANASEALLYSETVFALMAIFFGFSRDIPQFFVIAGSILAPIAAAAYIENAGGLAILLGGAPKVE
jgi:hypothetical protein